MRWEASGGFQTPIESRPPLRFDQRLLFPEVADKPRLGTYKSLVAARTVRIHLF